MELLSLAVVAGAVGVSRFVSANAERIVEAIGERIESKFDADERLVVHTVLVKSAKSDAVELKEQ